jgi:serine protease Do
MSPGTTGRAALPAGPTVVVAHLSGPARGQTATLTESTVRIDPRGAGGVGFVPAGDPAHQAAIGSLHRSGESYELVVAPGRRAWVNGVEVRTHLLRTGDVIEIEDGPVLRLRLYPAGVRGYKSLADVFSDCVDCARRDRRPMWLKAPGLMANLLRDLSTQTSRWFRAGVVLVLAALLAVVVYQAWHTRALERRLAEEQQRFAGLADLLRRVESNALTRDEYSAEREELAEGLRQAEERLAALEARSAAAGRIIAEASPSVVFLLGGFGFEDPATRRPLRLAVGPDGQPTRVPGGGPLVTLEGEGPPLEVNYTGTAFIVSREGLLLTNRHVARPWESDGGVPGMTRMGLRPVMRRLLGYVAGPGVAFEVKLLGVSESADLAVLQCEEAARLRPPLRLAARPPRAGDEVLLLGYPTGIRALLARAGERFVETLGSRPDLDFWAIARELGRAGLITPLASRGIVGQVTAEAIVYDAETTQGGSGGPVLNLGGEVVAVNRAILPEFGGSNLGVPARYARELTARLGLRLPE